MNKAYLALGTNIEPRLDYLHDALRALEDHQAIEIKQESSIYETVPVGYKDQADFLNMVIEVETRLTSMELLDYCQQVELNLGRKRDIRFGPRTIDLDILTFNQENSKIERLIIPHPRMQERAFVLIPLKEIAADYLIPVLDKRPQELIHALPKADINDVRKMQV
ncbi:2-amino-4-hydroxy-6-hydroxymethyldihydropteridine diphosphokinase [Oceanobacillus sp. 143]|uniref:2-amino-4-hydroxy-6-hydroxymethyldihydropteridine diphosphokinase n=1 Tax=Oceanobacillus zhaokaii TaxID=2052660 RepID=A0A345PC36_9BACI|nr:2-amino-4-hydroxy-6-hydroxymethyldihydropteridine diphosphokinase [Oceanobacillus zhaokaii]AXI07566.1 2-amino-4-hydroxy-6-hydroxymethyldihydropteridine diphosphokinase [Oceanobacillus zhaokaii]QGS67784.1 2-amino-4-hydroxy-6-hydroxymethyldihydropteridine diphosphokinase [Oceanobacillus sp. 143]